MNEVKMSYLIFVKNVKKTLYRVTISLYAWILIFMRFHVACIQV